MEAQLMKRYYAALRWVTSIVVFTFSLSTVFILPSHAAMVETADFLRSQDDSMARQKVHGFLNREDVARQLEAWGVPAEQAQARVNAMTDHEIAILAESIDTMPAGGVDAIAIILAVSIISFVTLVITDMLGVTDVFSFISKR